MKVKVNVKANSIYKRLQVWNSIFDLTNKELEVLAVFIKLNRDKETHNQDWLQISLDPKTRKKKMRKIIKIYCV